MKIQRGIVEYKGRNDIECLYATTDDKKIYYFLDAKDENKYSNGARLATTVLLEAVDAEAPKSHIGLLGENGEEIIPFTHREIVPINDENPEILLAKLADPTNDCVVEANKAKNDPALATKLVSNQALIKDKMKSKMGSEGIFLFHNQFLEATVYDINGRNLAGDGYYSFIGFSKDKLFFSLNTSESEIVETSLFPIDENDTESSINVEEAVISPDVVENALESSNDLQPPVVDVIPSLGNDISNPVEDDTNEDSGNNEESTSDAIGVDDLMDSSISDNTVEIDNSVSESENENENSNSLDADSLFASDEGKDETSPEEDTSANENKTAEDVSFEFPIEEDESLEEEKDLDSKEEKENIDNELSDSKDEKVDDIMIDNVDSYETDFYDENDSLQDVSYDNSINNNIGDIASFISRLMEKHKDVLLSNKKLLQANQTLKSNLKKVTDSKNDILRKNGMMEQKVEMQEQRIKKQEQRMTSLMDRLQELEGKNQEMANRINSYQKELKSYNTQKAELDKILKDAKEFLRDDSYHFSDDDYNYAA